MTGRCYSRRRPPSPRADDHGNNNDNDADMAVVKSLPQHKKSVSWPDESGGPHESPDTRALTKIQYIDQRTAWQAQERAAYWYSDDDYTDIKTEAEAIVFFMDQASVGAAASMVDCHCTRGLERQTEHGKWERYEARRNHCHAVLDECDRQRQGQRAAKGGRFINWMVKVEWDWLVIADLALRESRTQIRQALKRGKQDWEDIQDDQFARDGLLQKKRSRIERTCSECTAETLPLSDDEDESDYEDEGSTSLTSSRRSPKEDPLWSLLHDPEQDQDDTEFHPSCLDLIHVLSAVEQSMKDTDVDDSDRDNNYEDGNLPLPPSSSLILAKHRTTTASQRQQHQHDASADSLLPLPLPRTLFELHNKINNKRHNKPKSGSTTIFLHDSHKYGLPEIMPTQQEKDVFAPTAGENANRWQASSSDLTPTSTAKSSAPPSRPQRRKSDDGSPEQQGRELAQNDSTQVRPTRKIPRRTSGKPSSTLVKALPRRSHSAGHLASAPNKLPQRSQSPQPVVVRRRSAPQEQMGSHHSSVSSLKHKYIIVDATCHDKPLSPPKPSLAPQRRNSMDQRSDDCRQGQKLRRHSICTLLENKWPHFGSSIGQRTKEFELPASKAFPFSPVHLQDDSKPVSSPWTWKPSVLDELAIVQPHDTATEAVVSTKPVTASALTMTTVSLTLYLKRHAQNNTAMTEVTCASQDGDGDEYLSEHKFHASLQLCGLVGRSWASRQRTMSVNSGL